ncbi:hypothetical protein TSUD_405010 [Trifolium subterraneum]|uniref:Retrotransposon Copia-like N-terminal domain-containing protein n=1 Tax=Trifolium subterraneum TaxID=3900 RepID=A0A2Z6NVS6_TRISU|nr:hypothetical protein TSUD_405010 [Trifolium subterraneum]
MPPRVAPSEPSLDLSNPFYVHPGDGPSSVTVTSILTGSNYHSWSRTMRRALGGKMKLDFIDGTFPIPTDSFDPIFRPWNRCNMLIHSWIHNSGSESIAHSLVFMEDAIDVWNDLKERFSQGNLVRISELQHEIYSLRQDSKYVTDFYSDLKILWEELEVYLPIPTCSCRVQCSCEAMRSARKNHSLLHTVRLLTGLNDNFSMVKSQILLMDPLPPINKVFAMVIQHERQGNFAGNDDSSVLVNAARYGKGASSSKSSRVCTYCGMGNHVVDQCYRKHGLPPHLRKSSGSVNVAVEGGDDTTTAPPTTTSTPSISQAQFDQLMALLQNSTVNQASSSASSNQVGSSMDQRTNGMIGFAEEFDGLYYIKLTDKTVHASNVDGTQSPIIPTQALWHFRLGHLSSRILNRTKQKSHPRRSSFEHLKDTV